MSISANVARIVYEKNPSMPDQACANGLHIPTKPPELQDITPLERQIISLHIPFLTMLIMRNMVTITKSMDHE